MLGKERNVDRWKAIAGSLRGGSEYLSNDHFALACGVYQR
jgi:hypothetical protein